MIGYMLIGQIKQKTNITFKKFDDFEAYINALDDDYDSEDVIFTGWLYIFKTPDFNKVKGPQYGRFADIKQEIADYIGINCYIPTSGNCFPKMY